MKRRSKNTPDNDGLTPDEVAWLSGDKDSVLLFELNDVLIPLWEKHGDESKMFWHYKINLPITLAELRTNEDAWVRGGGTGLLGYKSRFIESVYDDGEKQSLWDERGNKQRYKWRPGQQRPEVI
jgi:hypothetical protein